MVLVDTSVWVDHLRDGVAGLAELLADAKVACHPFVIGELACGNLRESGFDMKRIYEESHIFNDLRSPERYGGSCGSCKYAGACGGCRARAYEKTGDYMAQEPGCLLAREDV